MGRLPAATGPSSFETGSVDRLFPGHEVGDLHYGPVLEPVNAPDRLVDRDPPAPDAAGVVAEPDDPSIVGLPHLVHLRAELLEALDPAVQELTKSVVAVVDGLLHPLGKRVDDEVG